MINIYHRHVNKSTFDVDYLQTMCSVTKYVYTMSRKGQCVAPNITSSLTMYDDVFGHLITSTPPRKHGMYI